MEFKFEWEHRGHRHRLYMLEPEEGFCGSVTERITNETDWSAVIGDVPYEYVYKAYSYYNSINEDFPTFEEAAAFLENWWRERLASEQEGT